MNGVRAPQFGNPCRGKDEHVFFPGLMPFTHGDRYTLCAGAALHITLPHLHIPYLKKTESRTCGFNPGLCATKKENKTSAAACEASYQNERNACCKQSPVSPVCTLTADIILSNSKVLTLIKSSTDCVLLLWERIVVL